MTETLTETAHQPIRALIDGLSETDRQRGEAAEQLLVALETAVHDLESWGERTARHLVEEESEKERIEHDHQSRNERCAMLEHDLGLARARVVDLEKALQQRTKELLEAQEANNALAAELQSVDGVPPLSKEAAPPPSEATPEAPAAAEESSASNGGPSDEEASNSGSVSERFAKLRKK